MCFGHQDWPLAISAPEHRMGLIILMCRERAELCGQESNQSCREEKDKATTVHSILVRLRAGA